MLARFAAWAPLPYTLLTGGPYIAFAYYLPPLFAYAAMAVWTVWRAYACVSATRMREYRAAREGIKGYRAAHR